MEHEWIAKYRYFDIKVINTLFHGERLYINDKLQDETFSLMSPALTGHVFNEQEDKVTVKVRLGGFFKMNCRIFIDDEQIMPIQIR